MAQWIPTRDGRTRCVRHGVDFDQPNICDKCIADPGDPDPDGEENELPYLSGLRASIEWEQWFADRAEEIAGRAEESEKDGPAAQLWGQAFKFARQAHTEASIRERQYLTQKHQREIAALRASNEAVLKLAPPDKYGKRGPTREDGN